MGALLEVQSVLRYEFDNALTATTPNVTVYNLNDYIKTNIAVYSKGSIDPLNMFTAIFRWES